MSAKGDDKRKVPNPKSSGYFLSYFWQVHDPKKWPMIYSSLINSFEDVGLWKPFNSQREEYEYFFNLNEEIKSLLAEKAKQKISNWDAEHAFWNHSGNPMISSSKSSTPQGALVAAEVPVKKAVIALKPNFQISDYLVPKVAGLVELGNSSDKAKGAEFEKMVAEVFKLLDFEVENLGQGTGRNPDAIIKHREEHTAFIVDAKAYSAGYSLGIDDRAIREYINY